MSVVDDLKAAKAEMIKRGRCTGTTLNHNGKVCAVGAVVAAVEPELMYVGAPSWELVQNSARAAQVVDTLFDYLPEELKAEDAHRSFLNCYRIAEFNDSHRAHDGDEEVLGLFDKAICDLGGAL